MYFNRILSHISHRASSHAITFQHLTTAWVTPITAYIPPAFYDNDDFVTLSRLHQLSVHVARSPFSSLILIARGSFKAK